ncbi:DJ-1/PfpI family protein [Entomohabitans teleogrylli]|uniref:DJ-1/PfpI family protein n=1 Tax=Entomohabitans teleogrylli TaxID=1384589 RepID=UPI000AFFF601|nr:DJ-1/PfpI family protein [Entomohabitans teleogrylli]
MAITTIAVLLFDDFETLDAMGPAEVFGCVPDCRLRFISRSGGEVISSHGVTVVTEPAGVPRFEALLIPGGQGTRRLCADSEYLEWLQRQVGLARLCMTVCTGSALLAATPLLDGLRATSNKRAFDWVTSLNDRVLWQPRARWVRDGKFYTSSGISSGIDMALQAVADFRGREQALEIAERMEYLWNDDAQNDPFAR